MLAHTSKQEKSCDCATQRHDRVQCLQRAQIGRNPFLWNHGTEAYQIHYPWKDIRTVVYKFVEIDIQETGKSHEKVSVSRDSKIFFPEWTDWEP